jgi:hypothetical protein
MKEGQGAGEMSSVPPVSKKSPFLIKSFFVGNFPHPKNTKVSLA